MNERIKRNNTNEPERIPVSARSAKLLYLQCREFRVKKPGHVDDRELVALVLTDDDTIEDLLRSDIPLRDLR
jgi:hypothetical protein